MEIRVKLFGTLSQRFPGYQPENGMEVEIQDGATVLDLLAHLEISKSQGGVVPPQALYKIENRFSF